VKKLVHNLKHKIRRMPRVVVVTAFFLFSLFVQVNAQSSSAVLSGHVIDKSQGAVPNASVLLVEETTKFVYSATTDASGDFNFTFVQPGTYSVTVTAPGYKEFHKVHIVMFAQQSISTGNITLEVGSRSQSVTVLADLTPLQTTTSDRAGVVDSDQIDNLLMIGRDPMGLMRTLGGAVGANGNDFVTATDIPGMNGALSEYVMASVDGVLSNLKGTTMDTAFNADSIKEITVQQSNYRAEYGTSSGSQINFVTKNGTQTFHGGLYYYFRNEDLNANSWINKYNGVARPEYRYNTAGGTIGGPVYWPGRFNANKDKLFFFFNFEDSPITTPSDLQKYRVITAKELSGDFSATYRSGTTTQDYTTLLHIKEPSAAQGTCSPYYSATAVTTGCYPGNVVTGTLNSNGLAMLKMIYNWTVVKNPNNVINNLAVTKNNYNYAIVNPIDRSNLQNVGRIDFSPNDKWHTFFRWEGSPQHDKERENGWMFMDDWVTTAPNYAANITYTITPNIVNEFNAGMAAQIENDHYSQSDLAEFQTTNNSISLPALYSGTNPLNLLPDAGFGTGPGISFDSHFPYHNVARTVTVSDNLTWVWHNHDFKFGGIYLKQIMSQPSHNALPGFTFSSSNQDTNDTNFGFSNAELGVLPSFSEGKVVSKPDAATLVEEWYYQDSWKAAKNLTLDLGLRQSYIPAEIVHTGNNWLPSLYNASKAPNLYAYGEDSSGNAVAVDPATGITYPRAYRGFYVPNSGVTDNGALYMNTAGYPKNGVDGEGWKWAPRFGFAWEFLPKTVLRGNYGIFYNARTPVSDAASLSSNAPYNRSVTQYYSSINTTDSNYYLNSGNNLLSPFGVTAIPLHRPAQYTQNITLGIQRELPYAVLFDIAFVGALNRHEMMYQNINEVPYGAQYKLSNQIYGVSGNPLPSNYYRPYPGLSSINMQNYGYNSNYYSMQVKGTRRYRNGLEFGVVYTFSQQMAYNYYYGEGIATYLNPRTVNYGPSLINRKHNLVVNYIYNFPHVSKVLGDKSSFNNSITRAALDNWKISGVAWLQGPQPYNDVYESFDSGENVTGGGDGDDILEVCDPWKTKIPHVTRTYKEWFNTSCFVPMLAGSYGTTANPNGTQYSLGKGNLAPNTPVFLPDIVNFQTALFKDIPLKDNMKLQIRVETYNTFNHTEFSGLDGGGEWANADSQDPSVNPQLNETFGQLNSTQNPRYVQLAARFTF